MNVDAMEIEELRARLAEAEGNLQAIFSGEIDALLVADEKGERRVFTLKSADAPYRALVERMQEGAATLTTSGDIVYCNQRFADLVKRPLEQVIGAAIGTFLPSAETEILRAMLDHGSGRYMTRLMLDGHEGTEVQVTLSSIVLDEVEHRTLIMSDISSLARAQRENRSKDEFLAMLAHELRNPLGAIQGAVHALGIIGHSDPMGLRATGIIKRQVLHMARLVDDLLDVGRAVTGKIVLKRTLVNLADCVKASVSTIAAGNANHGRIDLVSEPCWVNGDTVRLEQIVGNLISNALKFSQGERTVSVFVGREGNDSVVRVVDSGVGIPSRDAAEDLRSVRPGPSHHRSLARRTGDRPHAGQTPHRDAWRNHQRGQRRRGARLDIHGPVARHGRAHARCGWGRVVRRQRPRPAGRAQFRIAARAAGRRQP